VAEAPTPPPAGDWGTLLDAALDRPVDSPPLEALVRPGDRILLVVSDATRSEPRRELLGAVWQRLPPEVRIEIAIASGTHAPGDPSDLGIDDFLAQATRVINHDGRAAADLSMVATTGRGTPVSLHRAVLEADLVIATGRIKPHYFAGYGAGAKAIFPGLGGEREIRINHRLKTAPGSRPGAIDDNPCRLDLEEAVRLSGRRYFLVNVVTDLEEGPQGAFAGDLFQAFRAGAALCGRLCTAEAPRADLVVVSDRLPLTASLYQASKLVAAATDLLLPGGTLLLCAECPDGTGPLDTVNQGIFEIGIRPRLPPGARVLLYSGLARATVEATYCTHCASAQELVTQHRGRLTIVPRAGELILRPAPGLGSMPGVTD
jgi:nickel-dependent lactate racemase